MRTPPPWALWICLLVGLTLALLCVRMARPAPISSPEDVFSAKRAMADVTLLASRAHPIGSVQNDKVRDALIQRMTALGLEPRVHTATGLDQAEFQPGYVASGTVRNVIGLLRGRDSRLPAILLMAHYDSVPNSPGAADDIAGVAAVLETVRILSATGPHARDVMVLFTDGEEAGLLGADAFFRGDLLRPHVGVVLNLEARGDAGRTVMFQTGPQNGGLIDIYAQAARHPFANSLTGYVYKRLPNNTDFTYAVNQDLPGLNFAFLGDPLAYHTPLATPAHLSQESLQHMGDQVAPTARALADAPTLPRKAADVTYFDVSNAILVRYPPWIGWAVLAAAIVLIAGAWVSARRSTGLKTAEVVRGGATALLAVLTAILATHVASGLLHRGGYAGGYHLYRDFNALFFGVGMLCFGAVLAAYAGAARGRYALTSIAAALLAGLLNLLHGFDALTWGLVTVSAILNLWIVRVRLSLWGAWLGALLILAFVAVLAQMAAPLTSPLFVWPLLIASATAAAATAGLGRWVGWIAGLTTILLLTILGGFAGALFTSIGPALPELLGLFVLLLLPAFAPLLMGWATSKGLERTIAATLVLGALALVRVGYGFGAPDRPELTQALYLADGTDGPQWRIAPLGGLDPWAKAVLTADGGAITQAPLPPVFAAPVWQAPAKHRPITAPKLDVSRVGRRIMVHALGAPEGRVLTLLLKSDGPMRLDAVNEATVGVSFPAKAWGQVVYSAPPAAGIALAFDLDPHARLDAIAVDQRDGWPPGAEPPQKPAHLMAWRSSDTTSVMSRAVLKGD